MDLEEFKVSDHQLVLEGEIRDSMDKLDRALGIPMYLVIQTKNMMWSQSSLQCMM